jgi:hypothetical protein
MVLRFQWVFFLRNWRGVRNSPSGSSTGGELWRKARDSEAQASTLVDSGRELQGTAHDMVGQNGCGAGCRTPTSGWWSSRSVTRDTVISCACRTPSPSFPIRWVFNFDQIPLRFRLGKETPGSVCYQAQGRWQSGLGCSWATCERSQGRLGWANGESFVPWPYFKVKTFSIFQTILQFANYFEFNSN